jgi:hypothetical protein
MLSNLRLRLVAGWLLGLALLPGAAAEAGTLPRPTGKIVLKVTGKIANTNSPDGAEFDLAMLEGLGVVEMVTRTPWTEGEVRFSGVPAARLMEAVGADATTVDAVALNDYRAAIPAADFAAYGPILATRVDGTPLRVRDKGPVWVIYPWSANPELDKVEFHSRSIWQVKSLVVH